MAQDEQPQIYLISPPEFELNNFSDTLSQVLDTYDVACVRLALATRDESRIGKAADLLREVCVARDVAIVIENHVLLSERFGLDGVHLTDGPRGIRAARKELGQEAIVGAFCGASQHDGMNAGEAGADYVSFGPLSGADLGDGTLAEFDVFQWWSQMIELPVVAEGGLDLAQVRALTPVTDFFALGEEIWGSEDPVATLGSFVSAIKG
jgi:thiamine-phosphate pyrophosphorylase